MINIAWLLEQGPCREFSTGELIPCPGGVDLSDRAMYILLAGSVDIVQKNSAGGSIKISSIVKGDVFGGREYFSEADDYTYTATADCVVYILTEETFNDLSWAQPDILFGILRAAYQPPRKPSSGAVIASKATTASVEKPQEVSKVEKPIATEAVKSVANTETVETVAAPKPEAVATPAGGGIFPEHHKHYSDVDIHINMGLVMPKEYTCPFCKKPFMDFRVFSSKLYESSPMRYDLRKFYTDFHMEWFDVIVCANCLFSTFNKYFTDPKPIKKAAIESKLIAARSEVPITFSSDRDVNYVFTSHYLALMCSDAYPTMIKQIRAKLWGNLSWLYEDVKDKEMEKFAAQRAAEEYEQVYTSSRLTPVQEQITCLSIAGMQYRAGLDSNLKKFLFTAKTMVGADRLYAKLAEDFMYDLKIAEN
ncbi:MAG: DUF2225 domain-containing protein [Oscillospiraceae bacterium]|jgi:uncharacterized protein (DUF2225 family)|nr:DUF2225 domain-containing protein [Oscillospiraceae bacterium]